MIAARRVRWNFALERSLGWCRQLGKPLVIFEGLRWDFPWASDRLRRFVIDGMAENAERLRETGVFYYPYAEPCSGAGKGLLEALASRAAVVVTDDFPCFFLPRMVAATGKKLPVLLEQVDTNGLLPMRAAPKEFSTAYAFRRFLQKTLPEHLLQFPAADPLSSAQLPTASALPKKITTSWRITELKNVKSAKSGRAAQDQLSRTTPELLRGGSAAAGKRLRSFLRLKLKGYTEQRNEAAGDGSSGLSPYLHFGHISAHEIFSEVAGHERWKPERVALRSSGSRTGWWGMSESAENFLDQVITWRELGFNFCHFRKDHDQFESLPQWAQQTLARHAADPRAFQYSLDEFAGVRTHDPLWNAAQTQLVIEGRIHNYLRMLWGKKIIEWTASPQEALRVMTELNNRYALDGRDPNSYSGIFWCLGRYDHPWGPERAIFGTVRYMSSANTARKMNVKEYLRRYSPDRFHDYLESHRDNARGKTREASV
jgi:deoxyribodipyrimidine photo-lyase